MINIKKLALLIVFIWPSVLLAETMEVTLLYVGPTDSQAWAGSQQGLDEANLQGQFLGQNYQIKSVTMKELQDLPASNMTAILVDASKKNVLSLAQDAKYSQVPIFNLTSTDDALRSACVPNLFNILPSDQMDKDAIAQWQAKNPDIAVKAQAWHEDFVKFAASQLNKRFKRNHNVNMTDDAWAGWASVKMISDTVARTESIKSTSLLEHLKNDLSFDGQKGDTATFRETGQLRQIVLLVNDKNEIVAEAPLRGVKNGLDSLGKTTCQ
ncbi:MAG TPA: hypothetical protein ENI26_12570 [Methylophaga aminisulfidivorans]|uniref:Uncharacterized protein n=2 Tax=root TaxID=1 RepID=A0A7C1ZTB6_9GAMM|nr:hypothetical protein [Methylophaga aminisulfidivorans]HEC75185.1 hypothetical protein [Methylophaga aminisulfidivorans]